VNDLTKRPFAQDNFFDRGRVGCQPRPRYFCRRSVVSCCEPLVWESSGASAGSRGAELADGDSRNSGCCAGVRVGRGRWGDLAQN